MADMKLGECVVLSQQQVEDLTTAWETTMRIRTELKAKFTTLDAIMSPIYDHLLKAGHTILDAKLASSHASITALRAAYPETFETETPAMPTPDLFC